MLHKRNFILFPKYWEDQNNHVNINLEWKQVKFSEDNINQIPLKHGLYCFVVKPHVISFFETNYLFYIGMTTRPLAIRYKEYLNDQNGVGKPRPKIFEMLKLYKDYLHFYYTEIEDINIISENEEKLINTFIPQINTQIAIAKIKPELKNIYEL